MQKQVEVKYGDKWLLVAGLQNVKIGQTFRMWITHDKPVIGKNGQTEFLATSEPYFDNESGQWMINYDNTQYSEIVN